MTTDNLRLCSLLPLCVAFALAPSCRCGDDVANRASPAAACESAVAPQGSTHYPILKPSNVTVSLLSPGDEPRRSLRYHLTQDSRFAFDVVPIRDERDLGEPGRMTIHVEGTVACAGQDRFRLDYGLGLNGALHPGASAYALIDDRGRIEQGGMISAGDVDERGLTHPREGLLVPVPEEPVGIHGKWAVARTLDSGARQTSQYEVVSFSGSSIATRTQVSLATAGAGAVLLSGHGEATLDLESPVSVGWFLIRTPQGGQGGMRVNAL